MLRYLSVLIFIPFLLNNGNLNQQTDSFIELFNNIREQPTKISISNQLKINNNGGHLQGIQLFTKGENTYAVATGSSDSHAYYLVAKLGAKNEVILVNNLMEKPFKHAGGFQIFEDYMAVGIEDNSAKDKSKVCIYSISNPEKPLTEPISIIERKGETMRATAGCVGITRFQGKFVVAAGDWDTKHIDLYTCEDEKVEGGNFKKVYTIDTAKLSKKGWTDKSWSSYQNINLLTANNQLYLVGLGQNDNGQNVADLFLLDWKLPYSVDMVKVASKTFTTSQNVSFRAGAGITYKDRKLQLISCAPHIDKTSVFNFYDH